MRHEFYTTDMTATRMRHEQHECDSRVTRVLHKRRECETSEKNLILITARVKAYYHIPIFTIWQVKGCKEWNNFI